VCRDATSQQRRVIDIDDGVAVFIDGAAVMPRSSNVTVTSLQS
jgi:hypothetical protein